MEVFMKKLSMLIFATVVLIAVAISCERTTPVLDVSGVVELSNIPANYGSLVSVTTATQFPGWAQLWFQDDMGTIRMIRIQWVEEKMHEEMLILLRDQVEVGGE
jgi:hypothetical protein